MRRPTPAFLLAPIALLLAAAPARAETPPDYFFGTAGVPQGVRNTEVLSRFITPQSLILLTVDTTNWPGSDLALPGVKVNNHGKGSFTVTTLDDTAPATGVPFNYVVFNARKTGPYTVGQGKVAKGGSNGGVNDPAVTAKSIILLTVDVSTLPADVAVPGLKVNNHGAGFFTVTTLDLSSATTDIPFNYLVIDDPTCLTACTGKVAAGAVNTGIASQDVNATAAVFLTVDATTSGASDVALRGVKVNNHGAGFFTVTTDRLIAAGTNDIPFNYVVFNPPPRWEELGPVAISGKVWSIAADPVDWTTLYVAATGIWKSTDGGDSWARAWDTQKPLGPIIPMPDNLLVQVKLLPGSRTTMYALALDGTVYKSSNAAATWTALPKPAPIASPTSRGAVLAVSEFDVKLVCSDAGLWASQDGAAWTLLEPVPGKTTHPCSDVVALPGGNRLAAFRDVGVWSWDLAVSWAKSALLPQQVAVDAPIRIAASGQTVVVNDDGDVYVSVNGGAFAHRLRNGGNVTGGGQKGYAMSVGVSPTNPGHFIVATSGAFITFDAGATWPIPDPAILCQNPAVVCPQLDVGQDDHEVTFWSDTIALMATDKGPRISTDRGLHWREAATLSHVTDGPPLGEVYRWFSVSSADQFGRVLVGGSAQDLGGMFVGGNPAGFGCCAGEIGVVGISPRPSNPTSTTATTFRVYATNDSGDLVRTCDVTLPGPDYQSPPGVDTGEFPSDNSHPCRDASPGPTFVAGPELTKPAHVYQIVVHPTNPDLAIAGTAEGRLYRTVAGTGGISWQALPVPTAATDGVAISLYLDPANALYVGYTGGRILRVQDPFGVAPTVTANTQPRTKEVAAFAGRKPVSGPTEVYVAYTDGVLRSLDDGATWVEVTGAGALADVAAGTEIVGLALDGAYPFLHVATGHFSWYTNFGGTPHVWRGQLASPAGAIVWSDLSQGLPAGARITSLKSSPNRGLYIGTFGRGIWWRRDVAAVPPQSGVNTPDQGSVAIGGRQDFVTACSYPSGWKDIHTLDFKLALGLGPEEGQPLALWVEYDQDRNVMRFYDPDTGAWSEGAPGSGMVLGSRFAQLDLAKSVAHGFGPKDPRIELTWAITFLAPASAAPLQQYLQVIDDFGRATSWDRVGTFLVDGNLPPPPPPPSPGCSTGRSGGGALAELAALAVLVLAVARARRRSRG